MATSSPLEISGTVEGVVDEAVLRRLVELVGARLSAVYGKRGKHHLQQKLNGCNQAARYSHWMVLVDLNHDAECAPLLRDFWLPKPAPNMYFRVPVRAIEAWLMTAPSSYRKAPSLLISRITSGYRLRKS